MVSIIELLSPGYPEMEKRPSEADESCGYEML